MTIANDTPYIRKIIYAAQAAQAAMAGFLLYATVVARGIYGLPEIFGRGLLAAFEEIARGGLVLYLGPWVGLGATLYEAYSWDFPFAEAVRYMILSLPSHMALSLLWSRFRWIGGIFAVATHVTWNYLAVTDIWWIPVVCFATVYIVLLLTYLREQERNLYEQTISSI